MQFDPPATGLTSVTMHLGYSYTFNMSEVSMHDNIQAFICFTLFQPCAHVNVICFKAY